MTLVLRSAALVCWLWCSAHAVAGSYDDFFRAIEKDNANAAHKVLARGFDPNTVNPQGVPALLAAIRAPAPKIARLLAQHPKTKVELRNIHDESALMLAALAGDVELCRVLINRDADVNKTGWTPLHYAASKSQLAVIALLLEHYAYIDAASPNGTTPLMMAAMYGNSPTVQALLQAGADPLITNLLGLSALDFAKKADQPESAALIAASVRNRRP